MNTPAHLIFGLAAFGRPERPGTSIAAVTGALLPDLSLYLLVAWHLGIVGSPPEVVFGQLYYSEAWQAVFRVDNSFIIWGLLLAFALWAKSAWVLALSGGALLHLSCDFPLHHDDGRAHFWPISTWVFQSPVSYWDPNHFGRIVAAFESVCVVAASVLIWRRYASWRMRAFISSLCLAQLAPLILFAIMLGR